MIRKVILCNEVVVAGAPVFGHWHAWGQSPHLSWYLRLYLKTR